MSAPEPVRRPTINPVRPETVTRAPVGSSGQMLGGKYRLERRIATGGMASVWKATHVTLDRPVAVKFVDAGSADGDQARIDRFLREAKVAASVRHKNVVDILDFGVLEHDGVAEPYMIMELLEGEPLDRLLANGIVPTHIAIDVARQMLSGLDAVHRAGIVHRDVKPGNVFLTDDSDGRFARVLDFGISQDADGASDGTIVGTPEYMSPEQAYAEPLDRRSDLYSVGVILYEMLAGVLPFDDPNPLVVIQRVAEGTCTPLDKLRPDIPALCQVVACAMSMVPEDRFANARDMQRALADAAGVPDTTGRFSVPSGERRVSGEYEKRELSTLDSADLKPTPRPPPPPTPELSASPSAPPVAPRRTGAVAIAALVALALAGAIGWSVWQSSHDAPAVSAAPVVEAPAPSEAVTPPPVATDAPAPEAPAAAEASPVPELAPATTTPATEPSRSHRRSRTRAPGSIVRELDF